MNAEQALLQSQKYIRLFPSEKKDFFELLKYLRNNLAKNPIADFYRVYFFVQNNLYLNAAKEVCLIENSSYKEMGPEFMGDWFINKMTDIFQSETKENIEFCFSKLADNNLRELFSDQKLAYLYFLMGKFYSRNSYGEASAAFETAISLDRDNLFYREFYLGWKEGSLKK